MSFYNYRGLLLDIPSLGSGGGSVPIYGYVVDPTTGDDGNDGTPGSPWETFAPLRTMLNAHASGTVNVLIKAATYTDDHINLATLAATAHLYFESGCTIEWTLGTDMSGIQSGNSAGGELYVHGNGLHITGFTVGTGNGLGCNGNTIIAYDVVVTNCLDGVSAHGAGHIETYRCSFTECTKSGSANIGTSTCIHEDSTFQCTDAATAGAIYTESTGEEIYRRCIALPSHPSGLSSLVGATNKALSYAPKFYDCQLGTTTGGVTLAGVIAEDCFINAFMQLNQNVQLVRCYGKFTCRLRSGGSLVATDCCFVGATNLGYLLYTDFDSTTFGQVTVENCIVTGFTTAVQLSTRASYWAAAGSTIDTCTFFGNTTNFDAGAAAQVGTTITNIATTDTLPGSGTGYDQADYVSNDGNYGFLASEI